MGAAAGVAHTGGSPIDSKALARERLLATGVGRVHDVGLCTICDERFFSHRPIPRARVVRREWRGLRKGVAGAEPVSRTRHTRRTRGSRRTWRARLTRARAGGSARWLSRPTSTPSAFARTSPPCGADRAAAGQAGRDPDTVELLAATKYVRSENLPALATAGVRLVGENRAQALPAPGWPITATCSVGLHRRAAVPPRARDRAARAVDPLSRLRLGAARVFTATETWPSRGWRS